MLTVAEVSGIIAAGLMVVQYTLPAALVIILVKVIGSENSAATWSSVNRTISTTIWPILLRADTVGARHRSTSAVILSWTLTLGAALLVLASVMTPLGLRDEILPQLPQPVEFQYVSDPGAWGRVTPPRPQLKFGRQCEFGRRINCPGQFQGVDFVEVEPGRLTSVPRDPSSTVNTTIPANYTEMFSSATSGPGNTLSGLFDIQYRLWELNHADIIDHGEAVVGGKFRYIESLVPDANIHLKEGLIIDTRDGSPGVGFRNHTVPADAARGATWNEDLTWLEPVTQCVDTNLTVETQFLDTGNDFGDVRTNFLLDRGAFRDLDQKVLETRVWADNQTLDLHGRAYKAARMYNVLIANYLNLSLPLADNMPPLNVSDRALGFDNNLFSTFSFDRVKVMDVRGLDSQSTNTSRFAVPVPEDFSGRDAEGRRILFASNFTAIRNICRGYYVMNQNSIDQRASNITNPAVECGLVVGAGRTPGAANPFDDVTTAGEGLKLKHRSIYMCATGIRASVKTVEFRYNGTGAHLSNLHVDGISDKAYGDEKSKPLWAVETSTPFRMSFDPLWGMVSDAFAAVEGFHTMRSDKLWLPETVSQDWLFGSKTGLGSLAAIGGPAMNVHNTYQEIMDLDALTGQYSYPTVERYLRLSENVTTISQIPSLMLTDTLASLLVGTKTAIRAEPVTYPAQLRVDDPPVGVAQARVAVYQRTIHYDLRYAVPALLVLGLLAVVLCWVFAILVVSGPSVLRRLRDMYNQTSTGRLATALLLPGRGDPNAPTSVWVEGDGQRMLAFGRLGVRDADYFLKLDSEGEGGRPFLGPAPYPPYGHDGMATPDAKGMGDSVVRV